MIRLILGTLAPDAGTVRLGTGLQVAYFDQLREQLDPEQTVADTISPGSDWVTVGGERKHVMSYLGDFLFPPRRVQAKVSSLSGGERNRLLLARLFARPANLLVLDEPTNDLDIESLELLESTLQDYGGTLLLVSHDRAFLDNVVTQTLVAEGGGKWREYVGGYSDWLVQRRAPVAPTSGPAARGTRQPSREAHKVKLSFKEQRDLESLPAEIEALESEQHELTAQMASADYHQQGAERIKVDRQRATAIERLLESKFERWSALEEKAKAAAAG
jgi:ATP-binding cassette subfamily F protein uup